MLIENAWCGAEQPASIIAMMSLSEISIVQHSVDEKWCSPVADAVGSAWGLAPGSLRWWRSSASHVFATSPGDDPRGVVYVRFAPADTRAGEQLVAGTAVHERLLEHGADVASLVPAASGRLVETVSTPAGPMSAAAVESVEGDELEASDLDEEMARAWGQALARLHAAAPVAGTTDLPDPFRSLAGSGDEDLASAAIVLSRAWAARGRPQVVVGHGDFELDNLRWTAGRFVCFDLDEAGQMSATADLAKATEDLWSDEGPTTQLDAMLAGYSSQSGTTVRANDLVIDRAATSARVLLSMPRVIDRSASEEPALANLRGKLVEHVARHRERLLSTARQMR